MEYSFKVSPDSLETNLSLHANHLVVRTGTVEELIAYSAVHQVRLFREGSNFNLVLHCSNRKALHISNRFYHSNGQFDDYSRAYTSFVRVLHYHLRDKSKASYCCGLSRERLWVYIVFLLTISLGVTYFFTFRQTMFKNALMFGAASFGFLSLLFVLFVRNRFPKNYDPEQIPFHYLPDERSFVTQ